MTIEMELVSPASDKLGVSPKQEMGAYEALWDETGATFKTISDKLLRHPNSMPSDLVEPDRAEEYWNYANQILFDAKIEEFGVRIAGAGEYPQKLRDADHPIALLYYRGWWDLVNSRSIAVVGTRNPSEDGKSRTRRLVKSLVQDKFTIVSGLAGGIDTQAHQTAINEGGLTIGVIGTPISNSYPISNRELQERIATDFLLISQVPLKRWREQGPKVNRMFFPERNITMSALTEATVIVEAGETSGTLVQARHALKQKRKLFILDSCFQNTKITWPAKYEKLGAIRVKEYDDIRRNLPD